MLAKGTFYFDHSAGADVSAEYEVRTVDGAGNVSAKVAAQGPSGTRAHIYDDSDGKRGFTYTGEWERQRRLQPAYEGTISRSRENGAIAEISFTGREVLLFAKMGPECGKASVSVDGEAEEIVDTYSADDIWGVCVYRKALPSGVEHTLRVTVLGEKGLHAQDAYVCIDGARVHP